MASDNKGTQVAIKNAVANLTAIPNNLFGLGHSATSDSLLVVIVLAVVVLSNPQWEWQTTFLALGLTAVLLVVHYYNLRLLKHQPPPTTGYWLFGLQLLLIALLVWVCQSITPVYLSLLIPIKALRHYGAVAGYWLAAVVWFYVTILLFPFSLKDQNYLFNLLIWTTILLFSFTRTSSSLREAATHAHTEKLLRELEISHRQLQLYSQQAEELAATQERNRIAREIHDSLGHYLTAMSVQLDKALVIFAHQPKEAYATIENTWRMMGEALEEVRRSVATLRDNADYFSLVGSLKRLVDDVGQSSSFTIKLNISGSEAGFAKPPLVTLYRVTQEALTNVQKHADASAVIVKVEFLAQKASLTVQDNGRGFEPKRLPQPNGPRIGGYGLQGMRERLELIGGRLEIESKLDEGSCLLASVPKELYSRASSAAVSGLERVEFYE